MRASSPSQCTIWQGPQRQNFQVSLPTNNSSGPPGRVPRLTGSLSPFLRLFHPLWLGSPLLPIVSLFGSGHLGLTLWTGQSKSSQVSKERSDGVTGTWVQPAGTEMLELSQERCRFEFLFHYLLPMSSLKSYLTLLGFNLSLKRN